MEFTLFTVIVLVLVFAAGCFVGVMLGRRSSSANLYADRIQAKLDEAEARIRDLTGKNK